MAGRMAGARNKGMEGVIETAERLGREAAELEERNRRRRAKGRKPLPDRQSRLDSEVLRMKYRTGDSTTVDCDEAIALYHKRKAMMPPPRDPYPADDDDDDDAAAVVAVKASERVSLVKDAAHPEDNEPEGEEERAVREAAAVRRAQDMKAGRIDHGGNWSDSGQRLEGGDDTSLPSPSDAFSKLKDGRQVKPAGGGKKPKGTKPEERAVHGIDEFREDLYERLRVSFEAIETSLSDLQGRVAEIVTASSPKEPPKSDEPSQSDAFAELLSRKTPVTFDVGGTKMSFDAITVFHAPPCITVVSKSGSATIMPKPGARLLMSYVMDGERYEGDPVTFLGTRFDLPMFGLSFVGFIRDTECDAVEV